MNIPVEKQVARILGNSPEIAGRLVGCKDGNPEL